MHALSQKIRPKHQVLILKCYPRTTKGAVDVKPNSSELSYLLFYATSRRSKIQKVGNFLERKTASDVWRMRIGNVQVTLQILEALIEKNPKDLPLFAPNVLTILDVVLRSNDITMVESSIPTFKAFCSNHDASTLLADQAYLAQFEAVVRCYASLASTRHTPGKGVPSKPVVMRWRQCGLEAIRAVAASDALSSISGRQYDVLVPMILENLWTDNEAFLDVLWQRAEEEDEEEGDRQLKRRNSVATVRTAETTGDTNPIALSGTANDVDKLAEQDIGVLAMLCLKQIFITPSRSLIHYATIALLGFIKERVDQGELVVANSRKGGWSVKICGLLLHWAPVQERYIILITLTDTLTRTPLTDASLDQHIALSTMIGSLLRSEESLIGLGVMDVLLGLIKQITKLVQMPGDPATSAAVQGTEGTGTGSALTKVPVSSKRKDLLARLQQCIGDLATHVYYADQISDMVAAILFRLKPSRAANGAVASASDTPTQTGKAADAEECKAEKADDETVDDAAQKPNPNSQPLADPLFMLTTTKTAVLKAVKSVLLVASPKTRLSGNQTLSRNRVPLHVWEGTQWLLRDADGQVRKAYVDALVTWLDREVSHSDQIAREEATIASSLPTVTISNPRPTTKSGPPGTAGGASKRAVSNPVAGATGGPANGKSTAGRTRQVHFLSLLHLAIFDNALQFVEYETDIVLLHILLYKLVEQLGVNATRYGLPMVFQLQESIQDVETPESKVRVGSLVHGYFWTLVEKFQIESTMVGHAIRNEVTRRRTKHFWVEGVHVPPPQLDTIGTPGMLRAQTRMPMHEIEMEALLPFDDRQSLVENICTGYRSTAIGSPPASPGASPSRMGGSTGGFNFGVTSLSSQSVAGPGEDSDEEVPALFRDKMLSDWSRDSVMQTAQQDASSKTGSLSGSRTGTANTGQFARNRLALNTSSGLVNEYLYVDGVAALSPSASQPNLRTTAQRATTSHEDRAANGNLAPLAANLRKSSVRSGLSPSPGGSLSSRHGRNGTSATGFVTSVDQLKMALSGASVRVGGMGSRHGDARHGDARHGPEADDDDSESMASYDISASEFSFNPPQAGETAAGGAPATSYSSYSKPLTLSTSRKGSTTAEFLAPGTAISTSAGEAVSADDHGVDESVPPVPPLPSPIIREQAQFQLAKEAKLATSATAATAARPTQSQSPVPVHATRRNLKSRGGDSILSSVLSEELDTPALDLQSMLKGIDSRAGDHSLGNVTRPPY